MNDGTELQSPIFEVEEFRRKLEDLIAFLDDKSILEADVVFGFAWGNETADGDWSPQRLQLSQIPSRIHAYECQDLGRFGDDEVEIRLLQEEVSVLFCHERDVHLRYVGESDLVTDLKRLFGIRPRLFLPT